MNKKELKAIEERKELDKNIDREFLLHANDTNVTKAIYQIYSDKENKVNKLLQNSPFDIDFDYDSEDKVYSLFISKIHKKNDTFIFDIYSEPEEEKMFFNKEEIDLKGLSEEEIIDKAYEILKEEIEEKEFNGFELQLPKWQFYTYLSFGILSIIASIVIVILYLIGVVDSTYLAFLIITGIFLLLGAHGTVSYLYERLILKDEELTYRGIFKKQSTNIKNVKYILIVSCNKAYKVKFLDASHNVLLSYFEDSTIFRQDPFLQMINHYNIKQIRVN